MGERDNCSQIQWKATVLSVSTPLNANSMFCTLTWPIWQMVTFYYKHAVAETSDEMGPPDFAWVQSFATLDIHMSLVITDDDKEEICTL